MNSMNKIETEERESFAIQLVALGNRVVAISEDVRNRQADRLSRVTRRGKEKENSPITEAEEWPLLLAELRDLFWAIEENLSSMNEVLDLLEI